MKYLGIDFGTKNIGIAVSDDFGSMAFPDGVIRNDKDALSNLTRKIKEQNIQAVVFGESLDNNGKENKIMNLVRDFAQDVLEETNVEIFFEPERYTTAQVQRQGSDGQARGNIANRRKSKKQKNTNHHDASTAALILQGFLDKNM